MGKRFHFHGTSGEVWGWRGPFNTQPVPHMDETVSIKCNDGIIRTGKVLHIHWRYDISEIHIFLK